MSLGLSSISPIIIRTYQQRDINYVIGSHKKLYEEEYGFTKEFSDYVKEYVLKFHEHHDDAKENMWIAEVNGEIVGVIAVVKVDDATAQLRWFLVEPEARGKGLGHTLMKTLIDFCKENGYKHIILWTVNILEAARYLYKTYGFSLTEEVGNDTWANNSIKEERWDLYL